MHASLSVRHIPSDKCIGFMRQSQCACLLVHDACTEIRLERVIANCNASHRTSQSRRFVQARPTHTWNERTKFNRRRQELLAQQVRRSTCSAHQSLPVTCLLVSWRAKLAVMVITNGAFGTAAAVMVVVVVVVVVLLLIGFLRLHLLKSMQAYLIVAYLTRESQFSYLLWVVRILPLLLIITSGRL